jgi:hypothetical protein
MTDQYAAERLLNVTRKGLLALGYTNELLRTDYSFADVTVPESHVERVSLAAFAQEPPSYRTACFAAVLATNGDPVRLRRYASVGAPQLLTLDTRENLIRRWIVRAETEPELIESLSPDAFRQRVDERREQWNPQEVLRAKSAKHLRQNQLDFFDAGLIPSLEAAVQTKLDQLLPDLLSDCESTYRAYHRHDLNYAALYRLIFRLIAAKLLGDREQPGPWADPDPDRVIEAVEQYYFSRQSSEQVLDDETIRYLAWERIRTGFALQNLSVETLAYVYENTLVDPNIRNIQDIHATPRELAEYVVNALPFEALSLDQRTVFEPFAGHAPFLIAAMSRLRGLLPAKTNAEQRHEHFVNMLAGMELDAFAREVARYSLTIADYPNANGWKIGAGDIFTSPNLDAHLKRANIVLCNPPFGDFRDEERAASLNMQRPNKAAEILRRVLDRAPAMLGFVLPRVFTQGPNYKNLRDSVTSIYSETTVLVLPDVAFQHSEVEPVLLIAHRTRATEPRRRSAFVSKSDYPEFVRTGKVTWEHEARPSASNTHPPLWTHPLLSDLLAATQQFRGLGEIADIHRGIEYKDFKEHFISDEPKQGYARGLVKVRKTLEPYFTLSPVYLLIRDDVMLYKAHLRYWDRPKLIANAARLTRGPWAITAAPDYSGLVCSQRFHDIWPTQDVPLELLAAILVGPVANTLIGLQITSRDNQKRIVARVPVPNLSPAEVDSVVTLVRAYQTNRARWIANPGNAKALERACHELLLEIDAAVLSGYDLPPRLEREVLNRFADEPRPGPVRFDRYYPRDFLPAIPLRMYISGQFRNSSARQTLERLTLIDDPAVSAMIEEIS